MDEQVLNAMQRWPDVPAAYGWLRLDRRGRWFLIDRNQPGFDPVLHGKGSLITSDQIIDFIARNYASDAAGRWYWQNGPQKAYVDIEAAPLILRVLEQAPSQDTLALVTHTGQPISDVMAAYVGEDQALSLQTDLGPACVHDMDLSMLSLNESEVIVAGRRLALQHASGSIGQFLGFDAKPRA